VPWVPIAYDFELVQIMLLPALTVAIVGFVESTAVAKVC